MDVGSQLDWSHSLITDHSVTGQRISFTFRRLCDPVAQAPDPHVPPISPPQPVRPRIAHGTHRRVLFLTDFVLKHTPESIFNRLGGDNKYRCVKKINYELKDIFNFEPEFQYSDIVVISCGINDLARHGKRSEVLADLVMERFRKCCAKHKNTSFVFTSLLSTKHEWLNRAVGSFNRYMYELAAEVPNLTFFDTHQVLLRSSLSMPWSRTPVIRPNDDGIHITFEARKLATTQLVNGLEVIVSQREGRPVSDRLHGWHWPLRPCFAHKVTSDWNKFGGAIVREKG
jgi:hypothetical protein